MGRMPASLKGDAMDVTLVIAELNQVFPVDPVGVVLDYRYWFAALVHERVYRIREQQARQLISRDICCCP